MTVQRGIKATGTFAYQSAVADAVNFTAFIRPTLQIVCRRPSG